VGDIEYATVVPDAAAFRDYAFEPDGEIETSILDNIAVLLVILIDLGSFCQDRWLAGCRVFSAGRKKNAIELRTGNRRLRNNLQVLSVKPELLTALWAIASVALNDLAGSLQFNPGVEEFSALGA
jgi:hypothetical protein